ncbi:MAG: GTPase domain-containing protein [Thiohalobacteraceae bacterium]
MTRHPHTPASDPAGARAAIAGLIDALLRAGDTPSADPIGRTGEQTDARAGRQAGLRLAAAALRDLDGLAAGPRPLQVAVVGPTQAGKSTVVNLLLGRVAAETSPLAGFTVHPTGFQLAADPLAPWADAFFTGWERQPASALQRERLDCYALESVPAATGLPAGTVVWDTPDFDSLQAHSYQRGVLDVAALADVIVLVLSKEKYSDLSVWRLLQLLRPLLEPLGGRPLLICLNKVNAAAEAAISQSLRARVAELYDTPDSRGTISAVDIVTLPHDPAIATLPTHAPASVVRLRAALTATLDRTDRNGRAAGVRHLLRAHWDDWTAPVVSELEAVRAWHAAVEATTTEALQAYRREFLEHPQRFDTFRRAVAELLLLMEVPVLAQTLTRIRQVLTWPARQLFARARGLTRTGPGAAGSAADLPAEERVLRDLFEQQLTGLARDTLRRAEPQRPDMAYWLALSRRLAERHAPLLADFAAAAHAHHQAFQPEIEAAARQLHATLQQKPALLNTLRAARVTTDAAAVVLAVKTAGLGVNELLFAPAMVALTSMLTEGAVGGYMNRVAHELRERQYAAVTAQVFAAVVDPRLRELGAGLDAPGLLGIDEAQYRRATAALEDWPDA